jgi:hypothetical protein
MADRSEHARADGGGTPDMPAGYAPPAIESRLPVHDPLLGNIVTANSGAQPG